MANFNNDVGLSPDFGITITNKPVKKVIRYADGYEHRLNFGVAAHQNPRTVNLQFNNITEAQSDTLINFLKARDVDNASFDFTPENDTIGKFVVEGDYNKRINYAGLASVSVSFREVFEPS